jgi:DNA polymerase-3 subunit chi
MSSTRVDFYVIADPEPRARAKFACALVEKAFALGNRVHLHCGDAAEAEQIDTLLWTFRDRAFVPHARTTVDGAAAEEPVVVSHLEPAGAPREVLINLAPAVPAWFESFERVAEVVSEDPAVKAAGRERFRAYRVRGCEPTSHKIGAER